MEHQWYSQHMTNAGPQMQNVAQTQNEVLPGPPFSKPLRKLFRERGPARPQDFFRQQFRRSFDLPSSSLLNSPPQSDQHRHHQLQNDFPNLPYNAEQGAASYGVIPPLLPSTANDLAKHHTGQRMHHSLHLPSNPDAQDNYHSLRPQGSRNPSTPTSNTARDKTGVRWAKKALYSFSRIRGKRPSTSPGYNPMATHRLVNTLQQPHVDNVLWEEHVTPAPEVMQGNIRRKPLPLTSSLDSHLTDRITALRYGHKDDGAGATGDHRNSLDRHAALSSSKQWNGKDSGVKNVAGRGRSAFLTESILHAQSHHPNSTHVNSKPHGAAKFSPKSRAGSKTLARSPDISFLTETPLLTRNLGTFSNQPMKRSERALSPLHLRPPPRPYAETIENSLQALEEDLDEQKAHSLIEWQNAHQKAVERLDEWLNQTPQSSPSQDQVHELTSKCDAQETGRDMLDAKVEQEPKNMIGLQGRTSNEANDSSKEQSPYPMRFSMSTHSSAINAFELETRLNSLVASNRPLASPRPAQNTSKAIRRGFAQKMLSGEDSLNSPHLFAAGATQPSRNDHKLDLDLDLRGTGKAPRFQYASLLRKEPEAQKKPERYDQSCSPIRPAPLQPTEPTPAIIPQVPSMPQLGLGLSMEMTRTSHLHLHSDSRGLVESQQEPVDGAVEEIEATTSKVAMDDRNVATSDVLQTVSLSDSQLELLTRMEMWRDHVGLTPSKKMYAPSASASAPADGKTRDNGQRESEMTSISRRAELGVVLSAAEQKASNGKPGEALSGPKPCFSAARLISPHSSEPHGHSPHISFQGPASELVKFVRGSFDFVHNEKEVQRASASCITWQPPHEDDLIDLDDCQVAAQPKVTTPPLSFGTRHIRKMSEIDSQHLLDMIGDRLSNTCAASHQAGTKLEHGQLTDDEALVWKALNEVDSQERRRMDLLFNAYGNELRDFLSTNPRMLLHVKLRDKLDKGDVVANELSSTSRHEKQLPSSASAQSYDRIQANDAASSSQVNETRVDTAMQTVAADVGNVDEVSRKQQSLIELHKDLFAHADDASERATVMHRLSALERAVFVPT